MIKHTEEFKQEAVRIALPRDRVASDLGIGKSTLGKWVSQYRPSDLVAAPRAALAREDQRDQTSPHAQAQGYDGQSPPWVLPQTGWMAILPLMLLISAES